MGDVIKFPPKEEPTEDRFPHVVKLSAVIELRTERELDPDLEDEVRSTILAAILGTAIVDLEEVGILSASMSANVYIERD